MNGILLSYLAKTFFQLDDYDNLSYYLEKKYKSFNFYFNREQKVEEILLLARSNIIDKRKKKALELLHTLESEDLQLKDKIKLYKYLVFTSYINKNYNDSLYYILKEIDLKKGMKTKNFVFEYKLLGNLYIKLKDYSAAREFLEKSLEEMKSYKFKKESGFLNISTSIGGIFGGGTGRGKALKEIYKNLTFVYSKLGEHQRANSYLEKRLELLSKKEKKSAEMAIILNHEGLNYSQENKIQSALWYFNESFKNIERNKTLQGKIENLINIYNINFGKGDFNEIIDFKTFKDLIIDPAHQKNKGYLLYLRTFIEIHNAKEFVPSKDLTKLFQNYRKSYLHLLALDKLIDDYLIGKVSFRLKGLLYYAKYLINLKLNTRDDELIKKAIDAITHIQGNSLEWYYYYLLGENDKSFESLQNIYEPIPQELLPIALEFISNRALEKFKSGDYKGYIELMEFKTGLSFFNQVGDYRWTFASEIDNIFYRNIQFLKDKLLEEKGDAKEIEIELSENRTSAVNFFIKPYYLDINEVLSTLKGNTIVFCDNKNGTFLKYDGKDFLNINSIDSSDYIISYGDKIYENRPMTFSLSSLYYSKKNFNYNPVGLHVVNEKSTTFASNGFEIFNEIEGANIYTKHCYNLKLTDLAHEEIKPYHIFIRTLPKIGELKTLSMYLFFNGVSSFSNLNKELIVNDIERKNRFVGLEKTLGKIEYFGYSGIKKADIESFINEKMDILLDLAIKNYRKKKWDIAASYFQNLVDIYGKPFENNDKIKIFFFLLKSFYKGGEYRKGINYIEKNMTADLPPKLGYNLYHYLIIFYNAINDLPKSLAIAQKMGKMFSEKNFILPVLINQAKLLEVNNKRKVAMKIINDLVKKYSKEENRETGELILYYAHLRSYFQMDIIENKEIYEKGFALDKIYNNGKSIKNYFKEYLLNEIKMGNFNIDPLVIKYGEYIEDMNITNELCISYLKKKDYYNFNKNVETLLKEDDLNSNISGYNLLGLYHLYINESDEAFENFKKALEISYKADSKDSEINIRFNIALSHMMQNNWNNALKQIQIILDHDRKRELRENILYDLKMQALLYQKLNRKYADILKEMKNILAQYPLSDYNYFVDYQMWKLKQKNTGLLKNLANDTIASPIKLEVFYKLAQVDNSYIDPLKKELKKYYSLNNTEFFKNGVFVKKEEILSFILQHTSPFEGLFYYYSLILNNDQNDKILKNKLKNVFDSYIFIFLDNKIFRFKIRSQKVSLLVKDVDISEFKKNFKGLLSKINNLQDVEFEKNYFNKLFFKEIKEISISLIVDGHLTFFPFNIFSNMDITLYTLPFHTNEEKGNPSVLISKNIAYERYFKKFNEDGEYFLISDMNLNYNDIIYSYIGDYKIKNILKGKDLV
ncbi:tetratricopeptide repeat protein, partial [bacterium]|nr:tetratricopeptide repeat protein [bacterium]